MLSPANKTSFLPNSDEDEVIKSGVVALRSVWFKSWNPRYLELTLLCLRYHKHAATTNTYSPEVRGIIPVNRIITKARESKVKKEGGIVLEIITMIETFSLQLLHKKMPMIGYVPSTLHGLLSNSGSRM